MNTPEIYLEITKCTILLTGLKISYDSWRGLFSTMKLYNEEISGTPEGIKNYKILCYKHLFSSLCTCLFYTSISVLMIFNISFL